MKQHLLLAAVLCVVSAAQASVVFFDNDLQNGAKYYVASGGASAMAPSGEPTASSGPCVKLTITTSYSQAGLQMSRAVTDPDTFLTAQLYRVGGGDLHIRYGTGWTDLTLSTANNAYWSIDGLPGTSTIAANQWHTLLVNIKGLGITTAVDALTVKSTSTATTWYLDNVAFVPEPTTIAAAGVASLGLLRRRRQA